MTENNDFKAKINDAAYKAEQISDIALCAIYTSPANREKHIEGVLYGIISLCEALTTDLDGITD